MINKEYKKFVENYIPYKWEININDTRRNYRKNNSLVINYKRFELIKKYLENIINHDGKWKIIDFGPYPGNLVKLLKYFFEKKNKGDYLGVGIGFSSDFQNEMENENRRILNYDFDPQFKNDKIKDFNESGYEIALLLDVIEHLVNPIHCLDTINKSLKSEGKLLITTDNITSFAYIKYMIIYGKSPNIHPVSSSLFYNGDWRPHFKEFSKEELLFYLDYCGFEIIQHEYFDREQGQYNLMDKKIIKRKKNIKYLLTFFLKKIIFYFFPHLLNHHIIIAKKKHDYFDIIKNRIKPTNNKDEWLKFREKYNQVK